jgi:hypothetical protein
MSVGPLPDTGTVGVGGVVGVATATGQLQDASEVQDGLRHTPPEQESPVIHPESGLQVVLQPAGGIGVFVGVGEFEGVVVGVLLGVLVGVCVGMTLHLVLSQV